MNKSNVPVTSNYFLKPGYIFVADKPTSISTVLGSCVAVCLYDRNRKVGGMNHFQFPYIKDRHKATARYGNASIPGLIRMMKDEGSKKRNLEAQIFGGAHDSNTTFKNIGIENFTVAKKVLAKEHIRIISEDVGGEKGRKIVFNTDTNEVAILKVDKLRKGDWYPYESDR